MSWYAVRTYTAIGKIQLELSRIGVIHYLPAEKRLVRHRRKTDVWIAKRFALMTGYALVYDPDWYRLSETPGIAGVVGVRGAPLPIDINEVLFIRKAEAESEAEFDRRVRNVNTALRKRARSDPRFRAKVKKLKEHLHETGTISITTEAEA